MAELNFQAMYENQNAQLATQADGPKIVTA
jgi:hypothetical protein